MEPRPTAGGRRPEAGHIACEPRRPGPPATRTHDPVARAASARAAAAFKLHTVGPAARRRPTCTPPVTGPARDSGRIGLVTLARARATDRHGDLH